MYSVLSFGSVCKALPDDVNQSCLVYSIGLLLFRLLIILMFSNVFFNI